MSYKHNYVPKKSIVNWKVVLGIIIVLSIGGFALYYTLNKPAQEDSTSFSLCNLSNSESIQLINNLPKKEKITINDIGQYGDSLGLYKDEYSLNNNDYIDGKTMFLNNLCTGEESIIMNSDSLDDKVLLSNLKPGFYIIEILDGLDRYYLTLNDGINSEYSSVTFNNYHKQVKVFNSKSKDGFDTNEDYLILEVNEVVSPDEKVDIIIDPNAFYSEWDGSGGVGSVYGDLAESELMYDLGKSIVDTLNSNGLRAKLSRDNHTPINIHGIKGRLYNAYNESALLYINIRALGSSQEVGMTSLYSSRSSNRLSTLIVKNVVSNTDLTASTWKSGDNIDGVYESTVENGYDSIHVIREAGGRYTGAGTYGDDYIELNEFAKDQNIGMSSIIIEYGYLNDSNFINAIENDMTGISESTSQGIQSYFNFK